MKRVLVASLILGLMLSGGAFAASKITGKQIKDSSITGKDIKNKSLRPADFKGSIQGPAGPQGPPGPVAAGQITRVSSGSIGVAPGDISSATATCPAGSRAISGGYISSGADSEVFSSDSFGSRLSWSALLDNFDSLVAGNVEALAYCAPQNQAVLARSDKAAVQSRINAAIAAQKAAHSE
jgi:hypothetical protein